MARHQASKHEVGHAVPGPILWGSKNCWFSRLLGGARGEPLRGCWHHGHLEGFSVDPFSPDGSQCVSPSCNCPIPQNWNFLLLDLDANHQRASLMWEKKKKKKKRRHQAFQGSGKPQSLSPWTAYDFASATLSALNLGSCFPSSFRLLPQVSQLCPLQHLLTDCPKQNQLWQTCMSHGYLSLTFNLRVLSPL